MSFLLLVYSTSPIQANNGPETTYSTGKYMMTYQALEANGTLNYFALVWNTETGYSKMYYGNDESKLAPAAYGYQLPSSPL